jgi:hypothetical protein
LGPVLGSDVQRITLFVATFGQSPDWLPAEAPDGDAVEVAGVDAATLGDFVDSAAGGEIPPQAASTPTSGTAASSVARGMVVVTERDPIKDGCIQRVTISTARQALGLSLLTGRDMSAGDPPLLHSTDEKPRRTTTSSQRQRDA